MTPNAVAYLRFQNELSSLCVLRVAPPSCFCGEQLFLSGDQEIYLLIFNISISLCSCWKSAYSQHILDLILVTERRW